MFLIMFVNIKKPVVLFKLTVRYISLPVANLQDDTSQRARKEVFESDYT